jgi:tetratricopeptide (TPR) repeat protein
MKLYKSAGDSILALLLLKKICISMLNDGYNKEYISTCIDLFQNLNFNEFLSNWRERVCLDNPDFCKTLSFDTSKDSVQDAFMLVFHIFINELIKASMYNEVESYLDQYKNYINENSIHFAEYCSLQCIYYWYSKRFQDSIDWGEKFMLIKSRLNITDPHQTELYLALSLRDTRDPQNIKKALKYLLFGNTIDSLLRRPISKYFDKEEYYGNLGRCMQLLKQYDYALTAYMLSYRLVSGHITYNTKYNKAFLFQWLGEVYHEIGKDDFALVFLKVSRCYWEELMNSSYWEVDKLYQAISEHFEGHTSIDTISKIGLENKVDQIIKERIHDVTNGVI